ncbi:MAG: hypothetical protein JXA57_13765 [Armatimonadetes bacterium]|nr:hypothetical protein [Armatimonadota bacterium]
MSELCITCGVRPRKKGHRQCGHCAWRSEDPEKARIRRREYKRRLRRAQGAEPMEVKRERAAKRRAEREAKRAERLRANRPERKPWLRYPDGSAARYRSRYKHDPAFAQRERERAIVYRFTHPEIAVKSDPGNHWRLAAARADGSVTETVVRALLTASSCYLCGVELTPENRSIDHRVALILGGNHSAANLAACCMPCNREKAHHERRQAREARRQRDRAAAEGGAVKEVKHERLEQCVLRIP